MLHFFAELLRNHAVFRNQNGNLRPELFQRGRQCADTGCKIDIEDDGSIFIASEDIEACRAARKTIENIVFEPEVGELYYGKVSNIRSDFGAWVELAPGKDGLVKIKDLEFKRTEKVEDVLKIGDMTWVKVMNVDDRGRIDLSRKDAMREKGLM